MSRWIPPALSLLLAISVMMVRPLADAPAGVPVEALGLRLETGEGGVRIASLDAEAPARRAGVREGDLIVQVDGISVLKASPRQVRARLLAQRQDALRLVVRRAGGGQQELMLRRPGQGSAVLPGDGAAGMAAPRLSDGTSRPTLNRRREARGVVPPLQGAVARGPQSAGRDSVVSQAAVAVGDKFIDFTLPRIGGGEVTLHDLVGKPIFLDFWATWCAPCRAEAPGLAEIYKRYGEKIQMLGISLDFNATQPLDYAVSFGLGYPHLMTRGSWKDPVVQAYGIHRTGIPFNILMDASGRIVAMDLHGLPLARAMERLAGDTESR